MAGVALRDDGGAAPSWLDRVVAASVVVYLASAVGLAVTLPAAHATRTPATLLTTLGASAAVLVGGCAASATRRYRTVAVLALVAGGLWLGSDLVGWHGGPVGLRALVAVSGPFMAPVLLHVVLLAPGAARPPGRVGRVMMTTYMLTALLTGLTAVTRDPLLDPYCWQDCSLRVLAVMPDGRVADLASGAGLLLLVLLGALGPLVASWRTRHAPPGSQTAVALVAGPAALVLAGMGLQAATVLLDPPERPLGGWYQVAHGLHVGGFALLGAGLVMLVVLEQRRRRALRRLAGRLGTVPPVGSLEAHLAEVLQDSSVQVAHWLPDSGRFVDSSGHEPTTSRSNARTWAELRRGDDLLAVVTVGRTDLDDDTLSAELGAASRLAIDNERLQAGVQAQLVELRESRARVVEASDLSRRQLERDLHDGVQADVVGLMLEMGRRRAAAERAGDTTDRLDEVLHGVSAAAAALRELTQGVYPVELTEDGLEAALWTLVDDAPVPVVLRVVLDDRHVDAVERAAYLTVLEATTHAVPGSALDVHVTDAAAVLRVRVSPMTVEPPLGLQDRVGALAGELRRTGQTWEVSLPCGS